MSGLGSAVTQGAGWALGALLVAIVIGVIVKGTGLSLPGADTARDVGMR